MRTRDLALAAVVVAATALPVALTSGWQATAVALVASVPVLWVRRSPLLVGLTRIWDTPSRLVLAPRDTERAAWDGFGFQFFQ